LIRVAKAPLFTWLKGLDDGMLLRMKVSGGVPVLRVIATSYMTTGHTESQVNPFVAGFKAILTTL
jgi:hypothetical protein